MPKDNSGFTLIEILFAFLVMTILFGVGFANLRDFQKRQHLESAVRMLNSDLRYAQESALAGRRPDTDPDNNCEDPNSTTLLGYEIVKISGENDYYKYNVNVFCQQSSGRRLTVTIKQVTLPQKVILRNFTAASCPSNTIQFLPLGRGTCLNTGATLSITLSFSNVPDRIITVDSSGNIE